MGEVSIPLVTTNRINMPDTAEAVLARGDADMVSMARPFLADPDWVKKAEANQPDSINTCIACNQACLDLVFQNKRASCMVNPLACYETEVDLSPTTSPKRVAVVGAGPAGLAFSTTAASVGHTVTMFEADAEIGGQFNMAKRIPGKEEFNETLRYFSHRIQETGVDLRLNTRATVDELAENFDAVVLATGVSPRKLNIPGIEHEMVLSYLDVLKHNKPVGQRVALIGAGGIGFDVAEFLADEGENADPIDAYLSEWGVDKDLIERGGLCDAAPPDPAREIFLCQRSSGKHGAGLGKTTGWIHRSSLKKRGVTMLGRCTYDKIDDDGLHITIDGETRLLSVDTVVICAGQVSKRDLETGLKERGVRMHIIGGADQATELDARRAFDQGTRLGASF
jgi:2,4-dienoyl-CoA reductase (NADPH2)